MFDKKLHNSKNSCSICLTFSGLMPVGLKSMHGDFAVKEIVWKKLRVWTQSRIFLCASTQPIAHKNRYSLVLAPKVLRKKFINVDHHKKELRNCYYYSKCKMFLVARTWKIDWHGQIQVFNQDCAWTKDIPQIFIIFQKHIHPFIFMPAFPLGRVTRAASPGGLEIRHSQQWFQVILLAPHQDGTKQGWGCSPPGPWTTSRLLSHGFNQ